MTTLSSQTRIQLAPGHRLQFEPAQGLYVLLYPEGMVELSDTAAAVLERCRESRPLSDVINDLTEAYDGADLAADVQAFVEDAHARGWLGYDR